MGKDIEDIDSIQESIDSDEGESTEGTDVTIVIKSGDVKALQMLMDTLKSQMDSQCPKKKMYDSMVEDLEMMA